MCVRPPQRPKSMGREDAQKRPDNIPAFASWTLCVCEPPPRRKSQNHFMISALMQPPVSYTTHTQTHTLPGTER